MLQIVLQSAETQPRRQVSCDVGAQVIVDAGIDYLCNCIRKSGKFRYKVNRRTGECSNKYNLLRHAAAIIEICRARVAGYGGTHSDAKIVLAINYLASHIVPVRVTEAVCQTHVRTGETKLGLTALTALCFCAANKAGLVEDRLAKSVVGRLANHLVRMEAEFEILPSKYAVDLSWLSNFRSSYYPSQAGLSLVAAFELTGEQRYLDSAIRLIREFTCWSRTFKPQTFDHHWEVFCLLALRTHHREDDADARLSQLVDLVLSDSATRATHPSVHLRTTQLATRGEAAGLLALNAAREQQIELSKRLTDVNAAVVGICQSRQISGAADARHTSGDGGFIQTCRSDFVRIDYVQHVVAAALTLLHALAVEASPRVDASVPKHDS